MLVKKYNKSDKTQVEDIFRMYWTDAEYLDELAEALSSDSCNFYAVEDNGEIVGVAGFRKADNFLREYTTTPNPAELYIIAAKHKGKGIGNILCEHIIGVCKEQRFTEIICYSPETHNSSWRFYESAGFTREGIVNDPDDGFPGMLWKKVLV